MALHASFLGMGYLLGPIVGIFFFLIGGYEGPFLFMGLLDLLILSQACCQNFDEPLEEQRNC